MVLSPAWEAESPRDLWSHCGLNSKQMSEYEDKIETKMGGRNSPISMIQIHLGDSLKARVAGSHPLTILESLDLERAQDFHFPPVSMSN